jgi:hypothetical protein
VDGNSSRLARVECELSGTVSSTITRSDPIARSNAHAHTNGSDLRWCSCPGNGLVWSADGSLPGRHLFLFAAQLGHLQQSWWRGVLGLSGSAVSRIVHQEG